MQQIHERIKQLRTDKGLYQQFVARQVGISPTYLSDLEAGRRNLSKDILVKMCEVFGMELNELLDGVVLYHWDKPWKLISSDEYIDILLEDE
jgi:XRE family transcriptional regulator, regulator of sulfur utilization